MIDIVPITSKPSPDWRGRTSLLHCHQVYQDGNKAPQICSPDPAIPSTGPCQGSTHLGSGDHKELIHKLHKQVAIIQRIFGHIDVQPARYSWTKRFLDGLRIAGILQLKGPSNGVHLILTKETDQTVSHKLVTSQEKGVQSRYIPCLLGQKNILNAKIRRLMMTIFSPLNQTTPTPQVLENLLNIEAKSATSLNKGAIISFNVIHQK